MTPSLKTYLTDQHLNCTNKDLISTWVDDEDPIKGRIARLIYDEYDNEENQLKCEVTEPGFTHVKVFIISECSVMMEIGMPDSMWYRKGDEEVLTTIAEEYEFRGAIKEALQDELKATGVGPTKYRQFEDCDRVLAVIEKFTEAENGLDDDRMEVIVQDEIAKL